MTDTNRWARVAEIFEAAIEVAPAQRADWLSAQCQGDVALEAEVRALLDADRAPHPLLHDTASAERQAWRRALALDPIEVDEPLPHLVAGTRLGAYEIRDVVGRGGMGVVYRAVRVDAAFDKSVAIKVLQRGHGSDVLRRFQIERQTLASLDHPNIARLLDGGRTPDGVPYFVMEYVDGERIDRYCTRHQLSLDHRLRLFLQVCGAVEHAHQHLVIHRDLKPDNILVRADGEPKLLDFGIAKVLEPDGVSPQTTLAMRPMTPRYASPEQVRGESVTTATDIYSLGVLLYELLTGRLPYAGDTTLTGPDLDRAITEGVVLRPSQAVAASEVLRAWRPRLRGDLDSIALMALRKEPERRYRSVAAFADDIRRHLTGLPVAARPDTLGYRAGKFLRRNPLAAAAVAIAIVALLGGSAATAWSARLARHEAATATAALTKAEAESARVQRLNDFLTTTLALPDGSWQSPGAGGRPDMTVIDLLRQASQRVDVELAASPDLAADLHHTLGNTFRVRGRYENARGEYAAALALRQRIYPPQHPKVAESLYHLGAAEYWLGHLRRAVELQGQAIDILRPLPIEASYHLPFALSDVGGTLRQLGDLDAAERLLRESVAVLEQRYGPDDFRVAFSLAPLGDLRLALGDRAEARTLFERALALGRRPQSPPDASDGALVGLSMIEAEEGHPSKAEPLLRTLIASLRARHGAESIDAAQYLSSLSHYLREQGRYAEAIATARESLTIERRRLAPTDRRIVDALRALGMAVGEGGQAAAGERYLREAVALGDTDTGEGRNLCVAGQAKLTLGFWLRTHREEHEGDAWIRRGLSEAETGCGKNTSVYRHHAAAFAAMTR